MIASPSSFPNMFANQYFLVLNSEVLRQQIHQIKRASEQRLEMLRAEAIQIEAELHEAENSAKTLSIASTKDHAKLLASKQQELKQKREDVEAKDTLAHRALSGLAQISDLLCLPKSDEDAKISTIVSEIEAAIDTLLSEREKQQQQQQSNRESGGTVTVRMRCVWYLLLVILILCVYLISSQLPEIHASRSPELDLILAKHESPTVRLPKKLPSRPESENDGKGTLSTPFGSSTNKPPLGDGIFVRKTKGSAEDDHLHWNRALKQAEEEDENEDVEVARKTWDRRAVKQASQQLVRTMIKSASRAAEKEKEKERDQQEAQSRSRKK